MAELNCDSESSAVRNDIQEGSEIGSKGDNEQESDDGGNNDNSSGEDGGASSDDDAEVEALVQKTIVNAGHNRNSRNGPDIALTAAQSCERSTTGSGRGRGGRGEGRSASAGRTRTTRRITTPRK